jgi:hypothetical protein
MRLCKVRPLTVVWKAAPNGRDIPTHVRPSVRDAGNNVPATRKEMTVVVVMFGLARDK